jgi:hypothetical protein
MRWAGRVARMGETRNSRRILVRLSVFRGLWKVIYFGGLFTELHCQTRDRSLQTTLEAARILSSQFGSRM